MKDRNSRAVRFEGDAPDPKRFPKNHAPGALQAGMSVWYRGKRYYIERAPATWEDTSCIRLSSCRVIEGKDLPMDRESFSIHADLVQLAPTTRNPYGRQPSVKDIERRERIKNEGIRDNGDEVAIKLRVCKSLDDVYATAANFLAVDERELRTKYAHLDNGRQRMVLGNLMRGKVKKGMK